MSAWKQQLFPCLRGLNNRLDPIRKSLWGFGWCWDVDLPLYALILLPLRLSCRASFVDASSRSLKKRLNFTNQCSINASKTYQVTAYAFVSEKKKKEEGDKIWSKTRKSLVCKAPLAIFTHSNSSSIYPNLLNMIHSYTLTMFVKLRSIYKAAWLQCTKLLSTACSYFLSSLSGGICRWLGIDGSKASPWLWNYRGECVQASSGPVLDSSPETTRRR